MAESRAGRALWTLATLSDDWKRRVLYLGTLRSTHNYPVCTNLAALDNLEERYSQFDAVRGWLRMSNFVEEKQKNQDESERTYWCVPIVWNLLLDEDTSIIVAEWCFGGDLGRHHRGGSSDGDGAIFMMNESSHPYIKWALQSCYSDEESSDEESSNEESSDEEFLDEEGTDEEASDEELSDDEPSDDDSSVGEYERKTRQRGKITESTKRKVLQTLSHFNHKLISSICSYLALPQDKCTSLSTCWKKVLQLLEADDNDRKAKALSVLWLCAGFMGFLSIELKQLIAW